MIDMGRSVARVESATNATCDTLSTVTVRCCVCRKILVDSGPEAPISDGIGPECWHDYRSAMGLKPKPYPNQIGGGR